MAALTAAACSSSQVRSCSQPLVADGELGGVQDLRVFPDGRSGPQLGGELFILGVIQKLARFRLPHQLLPYCQCIRWAKKFLFHGLSPESQKSCPRGAQEHCTQNRENENRLLGNGEKKRDTYVSRFLSQILVAEAVEILAAAEDVGEGEDLDEAVDPAVPDELPQLDILP